MSMKGKTVIYVIGGRHLFVSVLRGSDQSSAGWQRGWGQAKAVGKAPSDSYCWPGYWHSLNMCLSDFHWEKRFSAAARAYTLYTTRTDANTHCDIGTVSFTTIFLDSFHTISHCEYKQLLSTLHQVNNVCWCTHCWWKCLWYWMWAFSRSVASQPTQ